MRYSLDLSKQADKFLQKHPELEKKIVTILKKLCTNYSEMYVKYDIKKIRGIEDTHRLRIGKYRVIFTIYQNKLIIRVVKISSRGDVYK